MTSSEIVMKSKIDFATWVALVFMSIVFVITFSKKTRADELNDVFNYTETVIVQRRMAEPQLCDEMSKSDAAMAETLNIQDKQNDQN
jgi:hypothetical protein